MNRRDSEADARIAIDDLLRHAGWDPSDKSMVRAEVAVTVATDTGSLVDRSRARPFVSHAPVYDLMAAAGAFGPDRVVDELDGEIGWLPVPGHVRLTRDHLVGRIEGHSMEPAIPDGSYCLFRVGRGGSREGKLVLVWRRGCTDPALGGEFSVKRYRSVKASAPGGTGGGHAPRGATTLARSPRELVELGPDVKGDVFEYLLTHLGQSALNGQFRTPRQIRAFMVEMVAPDLGPVTVLVGANNSGKSTILQALTLFQYCVETTRKTNSTGPNAGQLALSSRTVSPDEFGVLPVADPTDLWPNGRVMIGGKPRPIVLRAEFTAGATVAFELKISYNRFSIVPSVEGHLQKAIAERDIRLVPIFSGFLPREEYLTPPGRQDRMRLQRHGEVVRNLLWDLRVNARPRWNKLQELLRELFPESALAVNFEIDVDRFLRATYTDRVLTRERDIITAGSGFHQALQIFASVLAPGAGTILLDEPDAHLHARLQGQLMGMLSRLAKEEGEQFILATHSPQILNAAPEGSIRICMEGRIVPFDVEPQQLRLLEELGAMDRMELVPLLANRAVVFVEDKRDPKLLEYFACKHWGEKKQQDIWRGLTFLYTYQSPVDAGVLNLGRQVGDLLKSVRIGSQRPVRMVAIGDRDHRTDAARRAVLRDHRKKAKAGPYNLDLELLIWDANEIENYLLDRNAILALLDSEAKAQACATEWKGRRKKFEAELERLVAEEREAVRQAVATRIQKKDRGLDLKTALQRADEFLKHAWKQPVYWCDAKSVFSGLRSWLQTEGLPLRIAERHVINAMDAVPEDVQKTLRALNKLVQPPYKRSPKPSTKGRPK